MQFYIVRAVSSDGLHCVKNCFDTLVNAAAGEVLKNVIFYVNEFTIKCDDSTSKCIAEREIKVSTRVSIKVSACALASQNFIRLPVVLERTDDMSNVLDFQNLY